MKYWQVTPCAWVVLNRINTETMDIQEQIKLTEELLEGVKELNGEYQEGWENVIENAEKLITQLKQGSKLPMHDVSCCDFALWLQDNYSTNKKQGETEPLPKGYWRKDFTNEHYSITELIAIYNRSCS